MGNKKADDAGLTTIELAARWKMNPGTLRNWRVDGIGPSYIEIGGSKSKSKKRRKPRIRYPIAVIESYEKTHSIVTEGAK